MSGLQGDNSRLLTFIKRHAPFSIVELGLQYANQGFVTDCSRSGNQIKGIVRNEEGAEFSVELHLLTAQNVEVKCSCSSAEDLAEQWCQHIVALLWRATELGFAEPHGGFTSSEGLYRLHSQTPGDVAAVIRELATLPSSHRGSTPEYFPDVSVLLELGSDRLGVRVLFDGEAQGHAIFDGVERTSSRALDNILLRILDETGSWDEERGIWFINSSDQIEIVLGLIQEYRSVLRFSDKSPIRFSRELLGARLNISWRKSGAELSIDWLLPDGSMREKEQDLLGNGPYWCVVDGTVYRLSPSAARIAALFSYSHKMSFSRAQLGPILEALGNSLFSSDAIRIANPELQPETKVKTPMPVLEISRSVGNFEHFAAQDVFEVLARLNFDYPIPPSDQNIVYLPDKDKEQECLDHLKSLGFKYDSEARCYTVSGDDALELVSKGAKLFPPKWQVVGLDALQKGVRFVDLALNVSLNSGAREGSAPKSAAEWIDCHVALAQNKSSVPISLIFKNQRTGSDRWIRLDSGAYARVPGGGLQNLKTTLGMLDPNFRLSNTIKTRLSMAQALSLNRLEDPSIKLQSDKRLETLSRKLKDFSAIPPIKLSKHFHGTLRSYQHEGLSWLAFLREFGLCGILADEMGLGKTVQTLALIQTLKDRRDGQRLKHPVLVVAPTSVITNWLYEARRFTPKLSTLLLHGADRKRNFAAIPEHDIVITSYALLRIDRYDLERYQFSYLILDEAQNIKNYQAAVTKAAKSLKAQSRLALSGTPTENRPMELWSIMDFLMPTYLGSHDFFRNYIEKPILDAGPDVQIARFLNARTKPFILRRTKAEVEKDLPPKSESEMHVAMTDAQAALYAEVLAEVRPKVLAAVAEKGVRGASVSILAALLRLRQICNHPNSIDALKELSGFSSGKFNLLKDLVSEALENGRKILLFSQFREMLAIIRRWLEEQSVNYLYLDGTTRDRQSLVDRFNLDSSVRLFLISLKAGGSGLNLTGADTVVIYDPWWNPAVEHQAVDRAHRIGQTKPVQVYRLVTENSVEQKIMALKSKKAKLVDALINENGLSTINLTKADLESLFSPLAVE